MLISEQSRKSSLPNFPRPDRTIDKFEEYSKDYDSSYDVFGSLSPIHYHCISVGNSRKSSFENDRQFFCEDSLSSSDSSCYSNDCTIDALDAIENRHFENALECGYFDGVQLEVRKERKKSYRKISSNSEKLYEEKVDTPEYLKRTRSRSFEYIPLLKNSKRKNDFDANSEKMRNELVANGINLFEESNTTLDEVHELQQRFYLGLQINSIPSITIQSIDDSSTISTVSSRTRSLSLV
ncbi:uncharacterized protein LOC101236878 isoform X1 [Hydra vulgaris]|nr:uncharacterized protein LOC101236878 isoform X2 [Hydra vulgaris]XP_012562429.1 uncharacterized protein LOC101236878 isoform X2 [Hydra vulgaris]XP_012562431.1 uncharacterized protein LOC101236878 isoform X2 [Hydra vulgaris]XP_047132063.1 uncharacterized protein LOC101236878 isoform X2 [Hydra vulgaris]XP_047132064.1 uncharacterized protein LOC101236878 isoform X2 [Hydra vulgaris]XP_047132065.1 uncharacterized protein LOC101236878 isoform X2 [Hydra vulgaris]